MTTWIWKCRQCPAELPETGYGLLELPNPSGIPTLYCFCGGTVDLTPSNDLIEETDYLEEDDEQKFIYNSNILGIAILEVM